jgi:predicted transglutaminase-like cysteine proteinase
MNFNDLLEVNQQLNYKITYESDDTHYQTSERWENALENSNLGDCEDFAIAKLRALLERGWPIQVLRLTFCWVDKEADDSGHAVLVVEFQNRLWVLDNRYDEVREVPNCTDYVWNTIQEVGGSQNWIPCQYVFSKFYSSSVTSMFE